MYTLSQIRRRVDALKRKYAIELTIVRLFPLVEEFSLHWASEIADHRPAPEIHPFIRRIADHGFRFHTFMALHNYLERCNSENEVPHPLGMISGLLPQVPYERLRDMLANLQQVQLPPSDCPQSRNGCRNIICGAATFIARTVQSHFSAEETPSLPRRLKPRPSL